MALPAPYLAKSLRTCSFEKGLEIASFAPASVYSAIAAGPVT
jgi:hypothetical protein